MRDKGNHIINSVFLIGILAFWLLNSSLVLKGIGVSVLLISYLVIRYVKRTDKDYSIKSILKTGFVIILILGVTVYQPNYNSQAFMIKHFVLFGAVALLIAYQAIKIYKRFNQDETISVKKLRLIRGFIIVMIFVTIGLFSQVQMKYINHYVIPPLYGCSYYDQYNNLIYTSQYEGNCPELEHVDMSDTEDGQLLRFTVKETRSSDSTKKLELNTSITYEYDQENRVKRYNMGVLYEFYKRSEKNEPYRLVEVEFKRISIENTYTEEEIRSIHTEYNNFLSNESGIERPYNTTYLKTGRVPVVTEYRSKLVSDFESLDERDISWADYLIDIDVRDLTEDQQSEYSDLYNVYASNKHYHRYLITSPGNRDFVSLYRNNDAIDKQFYTESFEDHVYNFRNDRYFILSADIPIAMETKGVLSTFENKRIVTGLKIPEPDTNDVFNHFETKIVDQDYGFKLEHYSYERYGKFLSFRPVNVEPLTKDWYPTNELALPVEEIYSDSFGYKYPHTGPKSFVYQQNPLLFEDRFMKE